MKVKPLKDFLLVRPARADEKTPGGIVIPDRARSKQPQGEIVAIGPKVEGVQVGQTVLYGGFNGQPVEMDGEEYLLMAEEVLIATLE